MGDVSFLFYGYSRFFPILSYANSMSPFPDIRPLAMCSISWAIPYADEPVNSSSFVLSSCTLMAIFSGSTLAWMIVSPLTLTQRHNNPFIVQRTHLTAVVETMAGTIEFRVVRIEKPEDVNVILGQSHFIKTVEDIYEAVAGSVPGAKFGLAFCESSGDCLIRIEGNDEDLKALARENALAIGAGHSFILFLRDCYPINVLNAIKNIQEVCTIYCATANRAEVVIAESVQGRGIMGVIDGEKPRGVEGPDGVLWRTGLLRKFGYKRG